MLFAGLRRCSLRLLFFFTNPATTEIYTLSLHDALPILNHGQLMLSIVMWDGTLAIDDRRSTLPLAIVDRSEEHTSELQSHHDLVCRLLLEKKKEIRSGH